MARYLSVASTMATTSPAKLTLSLQIAGIVAILMSSVTGHTHVEPGRSGKSAPV